MPRAAAIGAYESLIAEVVVKHAGSEADLVLDLGAGWGRHLFNAWVAGTPRSALHIAAEITEAGRRVASRLAALDPTLRFAAIGVDLTSPDLSTVRGFRHAVVVTVHAVEQVPVVTPALFDEIRAVADKVTVIHFEPIGWQIDSSVGGSSQAYSVANDYNTNLWSEVGREDALGRLKIGEMRVDVIGLNPRHATSLLTWTADQ
jgi:hypothetical protein